MLFVLMVLIRSLVRLVESRMLTDVPLDFPTLFSNAERYQ